MICPKCGSELNMDGSCPNCVPGNIREMRQDEISDYEGVTVDENGREQKYTSSGYGFRWHSDGEMSGTNPHNIGGIRIFTGGGLMNKLLLAVVIGLILAGILFVALPLVVILAVVGIAVYILYSFFA